MTPTIPQDVAFLLPLIGAGFTHWLTSDRLAPWKNALIAVIFLVAVALLCAWLSGTFLLGSPQASVLAILAYVVVLMNGSLKMILLYLQSIPSPFDGPAQPTSLKTVTTQAYVPAGSSTPTIVPPRASQPPSTPSA